MENILEINNLRKEYKDFILNNISFSLPRGFIMGFIGPNGAGKSTTIRLIMNLVKKQAGEIKIFGKDNIKYEKEIKEKIGFVYDENYYYEQLTVKEMGKIVSQFYKNWQQQVFDNYLKQFNIKKDKKIKELSKGMKMKFSLAVALSHKAEFIIMDEPTSGLDPIFRSEILDILYNLIQDENVSIFFSTHITTDLEKVADYITFINNGSIVFSEEKDSVMEKYAIIKGSKELLDKDIKKSLLNIRENAYGFEALTDNKEAIKRSLKDRVIIEKPSLEDIMVFSVRK